MKKILLTITCCLLACCVSLYAQPTQLEHVTFENGIPANWTASNAQSVQISNTIYSTGTKSVRLKPSGSAVTLTSPVYNITAGHNVRLEFSHLPIIKLIQNVGAQVEIKTNTMTSWEPLTVGGTSNSPGQFDRTYGGGEGTFSGSFSVTYYWRSYFESNNISEADLQSYLYNVDDYYYGKVTWKNAVFYLNDFLQDGETSFQIRFVLPVSGNAERAYTGWFIDDIRLFESNLVNEDIRVPQITQKISYPQTYYYPNCSDVEVSFNITDRNGGMTTSQDSLYLEYFMEGSSEIGKVPLTATTNSNYTAIIPYAGVDSVICWRLVINDNKNNRLTFPFTYGTYSKFKSIIPYVGDTTITQTGTSQGEMMVRTSSPIVQAKYEMRYKASELLAAGFGPGTISGISLKITQAGASGALINGLKIKIGDIAPSGTLDQYNEYSGVREVFSQPVFPVPQLGWYYFEFTEPYVWDGLSDIVIVTCSSGRNTSNGTTKVECLPASGNCATIKYEMSSDVMSDACQSTFDPVTPTMSIRPNFKFRFTNTCFFEHDAEMFRDTLYSPANAVTCEGSVPTTGYMVSGTPGQLKIKLRNNGTGVLDTIKVYWALDGNLAGAQSSMWTGSLAPGSSVQYVVTNNFSPSIGQHSLAVWTALDYNPNVIDWYMNNDTAYFNVIVSDGPMNGVYAIGGAVDGVPAARTYETFDDAFFMMINSGVNFPVKFRVKALDTAYSKPLVFPECVNGVSATNTITFESADPANPARFAPVSYDFTGQVTATTSPTFTLDGVQHYIFRNLDFKPTPASNIIKLSNESDDIRFVGLRFYDFESPISTFNNSATASYINIGAANNIKVDSCSFKFKSTETPRAIYIKGLSPISANNNISIENSYFSVGARSVIYDEYNTKTKIKGNSFVSDFNDSDYDNFSEVNYAINALNTTKLMVEANTFKLKGMSAVSFSNVNTSRIANNMVSVYNLSQQAIASYVSYGINLVSGQNDTIVYNNVYGKSLNSYNKRVVGVALGNAGQTTTNNLFKNNMIVSDGYGYAITARPSDQNTSFVMSNNIYYKYPSIPDMPLLSYNGETSTDVQTWISSTSETASYYDKDPVFEAWDNLNTTSVVPCAKGVSVGPINKDFYGNARPTSSNPCIGAKEYLAPPSNIFMIATGLTTGNFDGESTYNSCFYGSEHIFVKFTNLSNNTIASNQGIFKYKVDNGSTISYTYPGTILPDSIYTVTIPTTSDFTAGTSDNVFTIKAWSDVAMDTINNNDTAYAYVMSYAQLPALAPLTANTGYGTSANLSVQSQDSVYWFYNIDDEEPFLKSHSFQTGLLYYDTAFYYSRKSEIPAVKISEIQFSNGNVGQTVSLPSWATAYGTANIFEISNLGSGEADISGYTFSYVRNNKPGKANSEYTLSNTMTKTYTFPAGTKIAPNSSVWLINKNAPAGGAEENVYFMGNATAVIDTNAAGFILKTGAGTLVDALTINYSKFNASTAVPTTVWSGYVNTTYVGQIGINRCAGITRINATGTNSSAWRSATAENPLQIGTYKDNITIHKANDCYGSKSTYNVIINNAPVNDVSVTDLYFTNGGQTEACALGNENLTVKLVNTGISVTNTPVPLVCKVYENNVLVNTFTENYTPALGVDTVVYNLTNSVDLSATASTRTFVIEVYSNLTSDNIHGNDTARMNVVSRVTPAPPTVSDVTIPYASQTTLTATGGSQSYIWYETATSETPLFEGNQFETPVLYDEATYYVESALQSSNVVTIGTGTTACGNTGASAYPGPFNAKNTKVKEQYLYTASDLTAAGLSAGEINSIAFNISAVTLASGQTQAKVQNYNIKMGSTNDNALVAGSWQSGLEDVYHADELTFTAANTGWYTMNFTTPYIWDGESSIVVEVCFVNQQNVSNYVKTLYSTTGYNAAMVYRNATNDACAWTGAPTGTVTKRPNTQFNNVVRGCSSSRVPLTVNVLPAPDCEVSLEEFVSPAEATVMSGVAVPIDVLLQNNGATTLTSATISLYIGQTQTPVTYNWTGNLVIGDTQTVHITDYTFTPGSLELMAVVSKDCDLVHTNDTIRKEIAICVGNNTSEVHYTISNNGNADYSSLTEVVNKLTASGICGPVVFEVKDGPYTENFTLPYIEGTSAENTITFTGYNGTMPVINTTNGLSIDGADRIIFKDLDMRTSAETLIEINESSNIKFDNVIFITNNTNGTLVSLTGTNNNIVFDKDSLFNGKIQLLSESRLPEEASSGITISNSLFSNFSVGGIALNSYNNVRVVANKIRAYVSNDVAKAVSLRAVGGNDSRIEANDIYMYNANKVREGIEVKGSEFSDMYPLMVFNNSISIKGTASTSLNSIGIDVDTSAYVNMYYNTVRMASSTNSQNSKAMYTGKGAENLIVRNNNLDNQGNGFAYYVDMPSAITISNNNNYITSGNKFAYWGRAVTNLQDLQTANSMDGSSYQIENPFANDSILMLLYPSGIQEHAEYIDGIPTDIEGTPRPVSPRPSIGAYQFVYNDNDAGVIEILPIVTNTPYIEGDQISVQVVVKNFGLYSLNQLQLVAVLKYNEYDATPIQTITGTLNSLLPSTDTVWYTFPTTMTAVLNDPISEPLYLEVYTVLDGDANPLNDTSKCEINIMAGHNIKVVKTENISERCNLYHQPVTVTFKNEGEKVITATDVVNFTYEVVGRPDLRVTEQLQLPLTYNGVVYQNIQKNVQVSYTFNQTANFYPLGVRDTTWQLRTFVSFGEDHVHANDTSNYITVTARVSPVAPIAHDDLIYYGTIGHPNAEQADHLQIKWFKDSTAAEPFYTASYNNNLGGYAPYTTTGRCFADSTYYVRVNLTGSYACESFYTPVKVILKPREAVDMAAIRVSEPLHTLGTTFQQNAGLSHTNFETETTNGSVYMEQDSVKFVIQNYGTTPASNFSVSYSIQPTSPATATPTIITETCTATIQPDQVYTYAFTNLADFTDETKTYKIRAWVDILNDITPLNDTSDYRLVKPLKASTTYPSATVSEPSSMDITRVQFYNLDNTSIAGDDTYSDFTQTVNPVVVFKGTEDTLIIQHANASSMEAGLYHSGWMKVWIDWNRNGIFENDDSTVFYNNHYPNWELVYSDTVTKESTINKALIKIPTDVTTGKTRMRIVLSQEDTRHKFYCESPLTIGNGEVEDYLVQILPIEENNAALTRFTSPSEVFQSDAQQEIKVKLRNMGKSNLTAANISWFVNGQAQQPYSWTGNLATSQSEDVTLGTINIDYGQTTLYAVVNMTGDTYNADDTAKMDIFRFKKYPLSYEEKFDDVVSMNDFYAYEINPNQPENCWQVGIPGDSNTRITQAYSEPNCWKTNINGLYPKNNRSILYSPMFDIELVKPDTLSFMIYRAMGGGASMTVEYMDYRGDWQIVGPYDDDGNPDEFGTNWYNSANGFSGTANGGWSKASYSLDHVVTNMGIKTQFRFIFTSGSANPSDGVAIDNFELKKGIRAQDAGAIYVELTPSVLPNYGQYFYPKVTVHNYGKEMLSTFKVCYMAEDMHIPTCEDVYLGDNGIAPFEDGIYTFETGHYLDVTMPDPFSIVAFTRLNPVDLYAENDTAWASVVIGPLEKDAAVMSIEQPTQQIVSGDDVEIAIRVRNYGLEPITQLPVTYSIPGITDVTEVISFNPPLYNGDEYIYRFNQRYHASYGTVNLKVWSSLDGDFYNNNDTLYKRLNGSNYTQDLEARYITIDDNGTGDIGVQLTFLNRSSIGVGNITVGYYYNGDVNNKVEETYRLAHVLPAGDYGHHYFAQKLPRAVYQSVCAYVVAENELNTENDTTCTLMVGFNDGAADTIFIEETVAEDCLVQLVGHNAGTLGGNKQVVAHYVLNGDWTNVVTQTFDWTDDEPNPELREYMTFDNRIPKSSNGEYDIVAWLDYPGDWHHWNDTTRAYQVKTFVGLQDAIESDNGLVLEQNVPNPYDKQTSIGFIIPESGSVKFYVSNSLGQVLYSNNTRYSEGRHVIDFDASNLEEGVYYYAIEFEKEKRVRKMIVVK